MKFLIVNGVNLNMTGMRETGVYGSQTLEQINAEISAYCQANGDSVDFYQSNIEGEICSKIQSCFGGNYDGIVLNAGAYTHYSYAIHDAIRCITTPVVEVHMSNVHAREEFRHTSVIAPACKGVVAGFGKNSYILAIEGLKR